MIHIDAHVMDVSVNVADADAQESAYDARQARMSVRSPLGRHHKGVDDAQEVSASRHDRDDVGWEAAITACEATVGLDVSAPSRWIARFIDSQTGQCCRVATFFPLTSTLPCVFASPHTHQTEGARMRRTHLTGFALMAGLSLACAHNSDAPPATTAPMADAQATDDQAMI
jgi:hypothetical protein